MIFKCENCTNRVNCPERQEGYKDLCRVIEAVDRACYHTAYYSVTLKCDYWVEDKETLETFTEQGGEEE
jgi:hypothetical protein